MFNLITGVLAAVYTGLFSGFIALPKVVFRTTSGTIKFVSEAPLETITAKSNSLKGIIDTTSNTFSFSVSINSFQGFNSALQEQHFYENYMESSEFPLATFSGKIIELIDYTTPGTYHIRAKGILTIHALIIPIILQCPWMALCFQFAKSVKSGTGWPKGHKIINWKNE